jgi:hypothetical protein
VIQIFCSLSLRSGIRNTVVKELLSGYAFYGIGLFISLGSH